MGGLWIDLTGNKYGMLTVWGESGRSKNKMKMWRCKCECGNETLVATNNLKGGHTQSCGCLFNKTMTKVLITVDGLLVRKTIEIKGLIIG